MSHLPGALAPTPYGDLNGVLADLVGRCQAALGDNLVGAYLQGSFALGDFDEHSDVDLLFVIRDDIAQPDVAPLQALHGAVFDLPSPWAQHLEASYAPAGIVRRWSEAPRDPPGEPRSAGWADPATSGLPPRVYPFWHLGNGERALVRSEHDNTQVVRWVTREAGIALIGQTPAELIDPVTDAALRAEVRGTLRLIAGLWLPHPAAMDQCWLQAFAVTLTCRILHTLATATVTSKRAASLWAIETLEPRWRDLIARALAERQKPQAERQAPADRAEVARTLGLIRYALALSAAGRPKPGRGDTRPRVQRIGG